MDAARGGEEAYAYGGAVKFVRKDGQWFVNNGPCDVIVSTFFEDGRYGLACYYACPFGERADCKTDMEARAWLNEKTTRDLGGDLRRVWHDQESVDTDSHGRIGLVLCEVVVEEPASRGTAVVTTPRAS